MTEGERWVRDALAQLEAAGFGPRAVARFLIASQQRANATRRTRPALARQARAWSAAGASAYFATRTPKKPALATWAFTALMLDWHLGMVETESGEPRPLGRADAATLARAWLIPLAAHDPAPLVIAAAAASDVLDGRLARAGAPTRAGRDLEGAVDAAFAAAAVRGLVRQERLSRLAAGAEALRLAAGFGYSLHAYFAEARAPDRGLASAARASTPIRVAGLLAASTGRRRAANALVLAGTLAGAAAWSTVGSWVRPAAA